MRRVLAAHFPSPHLELTPELWLHPWCLKQLALPFKLLQLFPGPPSTLVILMLCALTYFQKLDGSNLADNTRAGEHLCQGITAYGCCCLVLPPHLLAKPHP